ncbi:glycosyltransferase [Nocardiopsis changdeensis]|uniref:Glycosyltransferase n=1 Tax=Nocardiopsis changdeensis TaxID=2831969 RepID=A0ABX8BDP4_9ACTN|nr:MULTISPECIES: glycosyltransferase [Nocardiopsis]QUX20372.1 glycosyltransferase [Nocardiopsis changdeensis]QYX36302.1 glycosyltransferase [Nocardiopsis sp. MT53]
MTVTDGEERTSPAGERAPVRGRRILLWHVHGSWTTAFVQGAHTFLLPVTPDRGPDGRGRARTWDWPDRAREVPWEEVGASEPDLVVLQRPHEAGLAERLLGRVPGRDVPAVYVEHNTPRGDVPLTRHPLADRDDIPVVHVTGFNALMWDCGRAPVRVVEHGVPDPGHRRVAREPRAGVVVNEPLRRWRFTGTDLLAGLAEEVPLDLFGMGVEGVPEHLGTPQGRIRVREDLPQALMHDELSRTSVYVHTSRWTSLGLSLIEAMMLGLPVVALGATEAYEAVPAGAGAVSTDPRFLAEAARSFVEDPGLAERVGAQARRAALRRYGLTRFLDEWDRLIEEVTG